MITKKGRRYRSPETQCTIQAGMKGILRFGITSAQKVKNVVFYSTDNRSIQKIFSIQIIIKELNGYYQQPL